MPLRPGAGRILLAAILVAVITAGLGRMYWPLLARPAEMKFFGYLDAWVYTGPVLFYGDRVESGGELPLWNPYVFCGQPIAGNPQYLLFYPPNVVRSALTPGPTPWNTNTGVVVLLYLHALWAGAGAYLLGRAHGFSRLAALGSGAIFVFSAPYTQRLFLHHHLIFVVSWLPWTLFLLRKTMDAPTPRRRLAWAVALGIAFGMSLLAGSPQLTYLAGFGLALYWLLSRVIDLVAPRREVAPPLSGRLRSMARDVGFGALALAVAAAVSAALLLPAVQLIRETPRISEGGEKIEMDPSLESWDLLEVLSIYLGSDNHETVKAIGASGLLIALVGLFSRARRDAILFAAMSLLLLDASMTDSRFMLGLVAAAAPFPISSPGRMMMIGALPIAMLAGLGIDTLRRPLGPGLARFAVALVCLFVAATMFESAYRRLQTLAENTARLHPPMEVLIFLVATFGVLCIALWRPAKAWPVVLAAALMLAEPVYWRSIWCYNMSASRAHFFRQGPQVAHTRPDFPLTGARESARFPITPLYKLAGEINGYDPLTLRGYKALVAPEDDDPFWRGLIETAKSNNLPYLLLKRAFWLQKEYVAGPIPDRPRMFPPTTTAYIMDPPVLHVLQMQADAVPDRSYSDSVTTTLLLADEHQFRAALGVTGDTLNLRLPPRHFARHTSLRLRLRGDCTAELEVRIPENTKRGSGSIATMAKLKPTNGKSINLDVPLPDTNLSLIELQPFYMAPDDTLILESAELIEDQDDEYDRIQILSRSANTVEVELKDLPGYRILSFIDFDYAGWHVYLDGAEAPMLRTFSYFKGVEVPPGTHRVRFEYRSPLVYAGIAASIAGFIVSLAILAWAFRMSRTVPPAEHA